VPAEPENGDPQQSTPELSCTMTVGREQIQMPAVHFWIQCRHCVNLRIQRLPLVRRLGLNTSTQIMASMWDRLRDAGLRGTPLFVMPCWQYGSHGKRLRGLNLNADPAAATGPTAMSIQGRNRRGKHHIVVLHHGNIVVLQMTRHFATVCGVCRSDGLVLRRHGPRNHFDSAQMCFLTSGALPGKVVMSTCSYIVCQCRPCYR